MIIEVTKALDGTEVKGYIPETEEDEKLIAEMIERGEIQPSLSWGDVFPSIPEEEFVGDWSEEELAAMKKDSD